MLPPHPGIEGVMQKQIGQQWTDDNALGRVTRLRTKRHIRKFDRSLQPAPRQPLHLQPQRGGPQRGGVVQRHDGVAQALTLRGCAQHPRQAEGTARAVGGLAAALPSMQIRVPPRSPY